MENIEEAVVKKDNKDTAFLYVLKQKSKLILLVVGGNLLFSLVICYYVNELNIFY